MDFFITHLGFNLSHSKPIICKKHASSEGCKFWMLIQWVVIQKENKELKGKWPNRRENKNTDYSWVQVQMKYRLLPVLWHQG